jgi:glucose-6-phosphate 1-dehydrogenase
MLILVIFGASGHLALTKTLPSLYRVYSNGMLDKRSKIIGYARTKMETEQFVEKINDSIQSKFKVPAKDEGLREFLDMISYFSGMYDSQSDFSALHDYMTAIASQKKAKGPLNQIDSVVYYLAIPPELIFTISKNIKQAHESSCAPCPIRIAIEKPFGSDYDSAAHLVSELGQIFGESEIYRIDHYLGKEMVKNIHALRFANHVFSALWNREHISNVQITFKEAFGVQGRGGYFDKEGIIRDVMQNHLIQILLYVAMDRPVSFDQEDVKVEKVSLSLHHCMVVAFTQINTNSIPRRHRDWTIHQKCCQ